MKAVEFVKEFGWEIAKIATDTVKDDYYLLCDLKTLVEAKGLVDLNKGIDESLYSPAVIEAIKLVESVGNA